MNNNLFIILSKYKAREGLTPEENFTTEILVYILKFSLKNKTKLFSCFMQLLMENVEIDNYSEYNISTQKSYFTDLCSVVYPDITIERNDKVFLIEVKIESGINYYEIYGKDGEEKIINQIEKYDRIDSHLEKNLFLLSKYICHEKFDNYSCFRKKLRWNQIFENFKRYKSEETVEGFLLEQFMDYLKEKGMSLQKVSFEIVKGMESLGALFAMIEIALEGVNYKKSFRYDWLGYYLLAEHGLNKKVGWIGTYYDGSKLLFEYEDESVVESIKLKNSDILFEDNVAIFDFEKHMFFCLDAEKQLLKLKEWIDRNYNLAKGKS